MKQLPVQNFTVVLFPGVLVFSGCATTHLSKGVKFLVQGEREKAV